MLGAVQNAMVVETVQVQDQEEIQDINVLCAMLLCVITVLMTSIRRKLLLCHSVTDPSNAES